MILTFDFPSLWLQIIPILPFFYDLYHHCRACLIYWVLRKCILGLYLMIIFLQSLWYIMVFSPWLHAQTLWTCNEKIWMRLQFESFFLKHLQIFAPHFIKMHYMSHPHMISFFFVITQFHIEESRWMGIFIKCLMWNESRELCIAMNNLLVVSHNDSSRGSIDLEDQAFESSQILSITSINFIMCLNHWNTAPRIPTIILHFR